MEMRAPKMEHELTASNHLANGVGIAEVTADQLDALDRFFRDSTEHAKVGAGVIADKCPDRGAFAHQSLYEMAPDEPPGAGDQNTCFL